MKQIIRLTESDLHRIIEKSAKRIIKEWMRVPDPSDFLDQEPGNLPDDEDDEYDEPFDFDEKYYKGR